MAKRPSWQIGPTRRDVLATLLGVPVALAAGCSRKPPPLPEGRIVGASAGIGHRLRDGLRPQPAEGAWQERAVVIVGGGIAGLSAAWRLLLAGFDDFVLLELEPRPGGTSGSGASDVSAYPWGAHYLPVPMRENRALVRLLREMNVIEGEDKDGEPVVGEQYLIRDQKERIFHRDAWHPCEEPYLHAGESGEDIAQRKRFDAEVDSWVNFRDGKGRRAFAIPIARGSDDATVTALDRLSMADWMRRKGLTSPRLRWMVDYACRDDYGATAEDVSAWAGLFYFAARKRKAHGDSQPFMAWPEGNGRIVRHFAERLRSSGKELLRLGLAVSEVGPVERAGKPGVEVIACDHEGRQVIGYRAERVIFAAPQFVAPYAIRSLPRERIALASSFDYSVWMVANLELKDRPAGPFLAWDNILYESPSLGYVVATHQTGTDYGPTVLTYYYPLTAGSARAARTTLLGTGWEEWAEVALADLGRAHDDIHSLVERLDVMRWGHAMPRPKPGTVWGSERPKAAQPYRNVSFAHSDLSGVGIMEEAFYQGVRAAEEVLAAHGVKSATIL
ncbi:MAG: FAD-dependent oxidoreductase [Planctomycetes bacterium]|nr:FAD-dependent oxidoreductase [Planctomycetota bacterium]